MLFSNLRRRDDYDCPGCPKDACCWWETHREYERDSFLKKLRGSMSTALESFFDRKGNGGAGERRRHYAVGFIFWSCEASSLFKYAHSADYRGGKVHWSILPRSPAGNRFGFFETVFDVD